MAIHKTRYRPPVYVNGEATYPDIVYFETSADMVKVTDEDELYDATDVEAALAEVKTELDEHKSAYTQLINSELSQEHIIRKLPNGVSDEFTDNYIIKRIKKYKLQRSDILGIITGEKVDRIQIKKPMDSKGYNNTLSYWSNLEGYEETTISGDDVQLLNRYSSANMSRNYVLGVSTGSMTVEQARDLLEGRTLIYETLEPTIIPLPDSMSPNTIEILRLSKLMNEWLAVLTTENEIWEV